MVVVFVFVEGLVISGNVEDDDVLILGFGTLLDDDEGSDDDDDDDDDVGGDVGDTNGVDTE